MPSKIEFKLRAVKLTMLKDAITSARKTLNKGAKASKDYEYMDYMNLEFEAILDWFDNLCNDIELEKINAIEANKKIRELLTTRWETNKTEPLNILHVLRDHDEYRKDFFFQIATIIASVSENGIYEPIMHILMPTVTRVVPNNSNQTIAEFRLIETTEENPSPANTSIRRLKSTLIYVQNANGTESVLDAAWIYKQALNFDDDHHCLFSKTDLPKKCYLSVTDRGCVTLETFSPNKIQSIPDSQYYQFLYVLSQSDNKLYWVNRENRKYQLICEKETLSEQLKDIFENTCQSISEENEYRLRCLTHFVPPIALTTNEITTLKATTNDMLHQDFAFKDYRILKNSEGDPFLKALTALIEAVFSASVNAKGGVVEKSTVFSDENSEEVKKFYYYWKALTPDDKVKYGEYSCTNRYTLAQNVIFIIIHMPWSKEINNIATDFKVSEQTVKNALEIYPREDIIPYMNKMYGILIAARKALCVNPAWGDRCGVISPAFDLNTAAVLFYNKPSKFNINSSHFAYNWLKKIGYGFNSVYFFYHPDKKLYYVNFQEYSQNAWDKGISITLLKQQNSCSDQIYNSLFERFPAGKKLTEDLSETEEELIFEATGHKAETLPDAVELYFAKDNLAFIKSKATKDCMSNENILALFKMKLFLQIFSYLSSMTVNQKSISNKLFNYFRLINNLLLFKGFKKLFKSVYRTNKYSAYEYLADESFSCQLKEYGALLSSDCKQSLIRELKTDDMLALAKILFYRAEDQFVFIVKYAKNIFNPKKKLEFRLMIEIINLYLSYNSKSRTFSNPRIEQFIFAKDNPQRDLLQFVFTELLYTINFEELHSSDSVKIAFSNPKITQLIFGKDNPQGDLLQFILNLLDTIDLEELHSSDSVKNVLVYLDKNITFKNSYLAFFEKIENCKIENYLDNYEKTNFQNKFIYYISLFCPDIIEHLPDEKIFQLLDFIKNQWDNLTVFSPIASSYLKFIKNCSEKRGDNLLINESVENCLFSGTIKCCSSETLIEAYSDCLIQENKLPYIIKLAKKIFAPDSEMSNNENYKRVLETILQKYKTTFKNTHKDRHESSKLLSKDTLNKNINAEIIDAFQPASQEMEGIEQAKFILYSLSLIPRIYFKKINPTATTILYSWYDSLNLYFSTQNNVEPSKINEVLEMLSLFLEISKNQPKFKQEQLHENPLCEKHANNLIEPIQDINFFKHSVIYGVSLSFAFDLLSTSMSYKDIPAEIQKTTALTWLNTYEIERILLAAGNYFKQIDNIDQKLNCIEEIALYIWPRCQLADTMNAIDLLTFILKQNDFKNNSLYLDLKDRLMSTLNLTNKIGVTIVANNLKNDKNKLPEIQADLNGIPLIYRIAPLHINMRLRTLFSYADNDSSFTYSIKSQYQKPTLDEYWGLSVTQPLWELTKQLAKPITIKGVGNLLLQPFQGIKNLTAGTAMTLGSPVVLASGLISAASHREYSLYEDDKQTIRKKTLHRASRLLVGGLIRALVGVFQMTTFLVFIPTALVIRTIMRIAKGAPTNLTSTKVKAAINATEKLMDDEYKPSKLPTAQKQAPLNELTYQLDKATRKGLIKKDEFKTLRQLSLFKADNLAKLPLEVKQDFKSELNKLRDFRPRKVGS